jgi:hypothetical protein
MIWFAFLISTFILQVFAGVTSNLPLKTITDEIDKDLKLIKVSRSWPAKLWGKIAKIQAKTISSYPAPSFIVHGYDVRVTENFRKAHILGTPAESFQKSSLLTNIEKASFSVPRSKWYYGESKTLMYTTSVEMQERIRGDKLAPWKVAPGSVKFKAGLDVQATKYRGARASNGRYEKDILLIDDIERIHKFLNFHF